MKFDAGKLVLPKPPRYFEGQLLTADDLRAEQEYQREMRWQHNRMLHGYGIVVGLEVGVQAEEDSAARLIVSPGYGLDGWGRELVVPAALEVSLPSERRDLIVFLRYMERADDDETKDLASQPHAARAVERAQVLLEPSSTERAIAPTGRADFAIPLARLRRPHLTWQRDRAFRPARAR